MKHLKYLPACLLGICGALGFDSLILYVCSFPVRRHPISYPISLSGGILALCLSILLLIPSVAVVIKEKGARLRTILLSLLLCAAGFLAGVLFWGYAYDFCRICFQNQL